MLGLAITVATSPAAGASGPDSSLAPLHGVGGAGSIAGHYIVVLDSNSSAAQISTVAATATAAGGTVRYTYSHALRGFSAALPAAALQAVRSAPGVQYVEADGQVTIASKQVNPPSWGLDRVDQRSRTLNHKYKYVTSAGAGVTAYIIDTGIRFTHTDFGGRATSGVDEVDGGTADDCNGHGTHVAGTTGGTKYGVAKMVSLVAVRVLDCGGSGTWAGVIAGVDWVTANHADPAVANMSIQGGYLQAVNDAITASIADGVTYAIAAGNSGDVACNYSPGSTPNAITVGATDINDAKAGFSNYGTCLDLFAPGVRIVSDWNTSDTATNTLDGTSMSSPHVAGAAALYLGLHSGATPLQVRNAMVGAATSGVLTGIGAGSPNLLLFSKANKW
jgi:subtilisin family serine protease